MKKILFPTDFSKASLNAFVYAINLARRIDAQIITLHVYDFPIETVNEYYNSLLENYDIIEWGNFENYKSEVPKLRTIAKEHHGEHIKLLHVLERGTVVDTILEVAKRDNIDYIVMGTNGAGTIDETLFGTVAEKVMNRSHVMVLSVPVSCHFRPLSKLLFLTQFEDYHKKTLHKLVQFAEMFDAHIDVLQVKAHHTESEEKIIGVWKAEFAKENIHFTILGSNAIEETIMDFIELHHISIVAMTVKHKGLFERLFLYSIASKMAFHSKIPVLAVKYK